MKRSLTPLIMTLIILSGLYAARVLAQSSDAPWTKPVNISQSGAASLPTISIASDGTLTALWWDSVEGTQYSRGSAGITQTVWSKPVAVPVIVGDRRAITNTQTGKVTFALTPPRDLRLVADARGSVYALWIDANDQLEVAQTRGNTWSDKTLLTDSAATMQVSTDLSGTLHLAYWRALDSATAPAGLYYRVTTGGEWSTPSSIYLSPYFRASGAGNAHVSIAGDGLGRRIVAWDDPQAGHSLYAYSTNNGQTWSSPRPVAGNDAAASVDSYVALAPNGDFLLMWQDPLQVGCSMSQRRSTNGGQNWNAPEQILPGLNSCPDRWQFSIGGDNRLWMMGLAPLDNSGVKTGTAILAAWDNKNWTQPQQVSISFRDADAGKLITLSSMNISVAGQRVDVVGCDSIGDIWTTYNAVGLDELLPAIKPTWTDLVTLSGKAAGANVQSLPALAAVNLNKFYAMWSQSTPGDVRGSLLYLASNDGNSWTQPVQILTAADDSAVSASNGSSVKAEEPALAVDNANRLHAVWSGGTSGQNNYSWAYLRDAMSTTGWAAPIKLPAPSKVGSWPDIVADPHGDILHVIYAVPYNERRGIYYVRSGDGGATWLTPTLVFDAVAAQWDSADKPRLALDASTNVLHAVWLHTVLPDGAGSQEVYYSHSADGGKTWSSPQRIAVGAVDWPRVAVAGKQVLVVWNKLLAGNTPSWEVWSQFSPNGGNQWSDSNRVPGLDQITGPVSLATDGDQAFIVAIGSVVGADSVLLHANWTGEKWNAQDNLDLAQSVTPGNAAIAAIAPGSSKLGAILRLWVKQADGSLQLQIQATERDVKASPTLSPAPTFTPMPTPTPVPTAAPQPTPTPQPQLSTTFTGTIRTSPLRGLSPLILSGVLAAVIVVGAVVVRAVILSRR